MIGSALETIQYDAEEKSSSFMLGKKRIKNLKRELSSTYRASVWQLKALIRENPSEVGHIAQPLSRQFTKKVLISRVLTGRRQQEFGPLLWYIESLGYAQGTRSEIMYGMMTDPKDYYYLLLGQYDQTSN